MKTAGSILLIIGLSSATAIFLGKVGLVRASNTGSLWALFIIPLMVGAASVYGADQLERDRLQGKRPVDEKRAP
jgi:hypothetical protein